LNKTPVKVWKNGKWVKVHAGGVPQILGLSPKTPSYEQVRQGFLYIQSRYGSTM
jgi:saccharopine dehydrogenase-like NADP-dependent oxidoreductase